MLDQTPSRPNFEMIIRGAQRSRAEIFRDFVIGIIYPKGTQKTSATTQTIAVPDTSKRQQAALDLHRDAWIGRRASGLEKSVKVYSY